MYTLDVWKNKYFLKKIIFCNFFRKLVLILKTIKYTKSNRGYNILTIIKYCILYCFLIENLAENHRGYNKKLSILKSNRWYNIENIKSDRGYNIEKIYKNTTFLKLLLYPLSL